MPPLRLEEEWARQTMEAELGVPVVQHDDGSGDAMHDLEVTYGDGSRATVEITCAVDREQTEFWNVVNGRVRWIESNLVGGWFVLAKPNARQLRRKLPPFLRSLERAGLCAFPSYGAEPSVNVADPPTRRRQGKAARHRLPGEHLRAT